MIGADPAPLLKLNMRTLANSNGLNAGQIHKLIGAPRQSNKF
jgi:hypothetical protein